MIQLMDLFKIKTCLKYFRLHLYLPLENVTIFSTQKWTKVYSIEWNKITLVHVMYRKRLRIFFFIFVENNWGARGVELTIRFIVYIRLSVGHSVLGKHIALFTLGEGTKRTRRHLKYAIYRVHIQTFIDAINSVRLWYWAGDIWWRHIHTYLSTRGVIPCYTLFPRKSGKCEHVCIFPEN